MSTTDGGPGEVALGVRWWLAAGVAVVARPGLWWTALRQVARLARPGWWRRPPFLPAPDPAYLRFRLRTQYGEDRAPSPSDLVAYLSWCRAWPHIARA